MKSYYVKLKIHVIVPRCYIVGNKDVLQPTSLPVPFLQTCYLPQCWPQTQPKQRAGSSAHAPSSSPSALPLFLSPSLSPFLVMEKCPDQSRDGWKTGEKREVDVEKRKDGRGLRGTFWNSDVGRGCAQPFGGRSTALVERVVLALVVGLELAAEIWGHTCLTSVSAQGRGDQGGAALIVFYFLSFNS